MRRATQTRRALFPSNYKNVPEHCVEINQLFKRRRGAAKINMLTCHSVCIIHISEGPQSYNDINTKNLNKFPTDCILNDTFPKMSQGQSFGTK